MSRRDTDQADRDAAADLRIGRDLEREPGPRRIRIHQPTRAEPHMISRSAFAIGVQNSVNASKSVDRACPSCGGSVYVPGDSHAEAVDCTGCGAALDTRRADGGEVDLALARTDGAA